VSHVRVIVSLIEKRPVTLAEILEMLSKKWRQRRMARGQSRVYFAFRSRDRGS
jgi:hypothetical protein